MRFVDVLSVLSKSHCFNGFKQAALLSSHRALFRHVDFYCFKQKGDRKEKVV
jgi:hypothetical protein